MFRLLNKKIVEKVYFLLILAVPVIYGGVFLHSFFDKASMILVDNEFENSIEDNAPDTDTNVDDFDQSDFSSLLALDFIEFSPLFLTKNIPCLLVNSYCNICLQQQNPPPDKY